MAFMLAPGITYCAIDGTRIFLDRRRDRYFSLGPGAEAVFTILESCEPLGSEHADRLAVLASAGILTANPDGGAVTPCPAARIDSAPLDEEGPNAPGAMLIATAACALQRAKIELGWFGFARVLGRLADGRDSRRDGSRPATTGELARVAEGFAAARRLVGGFEQCLPLSIAVVRHCRSRGIDASLWLGVKLRPFQAHAWANAGTVLLSDRRATVEQFTPILSL